MLPWTRIVSGHVASLAGTTTTSAGGPLSGRASLGGACGDCSQPDQIKLHIATTPNKTGLSGAGVSMGIRGGRLREGGATCAARGRPLGRDSHYTRRPCLMESVSLT